MRKVIASLLVTSAVLAAGAAHAAVVIQDGFVQAGVNDVGTLGSGGSTAPGILYDPTGTGNYGNNDFLTPGDPYEGFYITGAGGFHEQQNNDGNFNSFGAATLSGVTATGATQLVNAIDGSLSVSNVYSLTTIGGRSVIAITTMLTNTSGGALTGLQFLRTLDPDPDVNNFGSYTTQNSLPNPSEACGTGPISGQTICITTSDTDYTSGAGIGPGGGDFGSWDTTPSDFLGHIFDSPFADDSIGLAFNLGNLGAGDSATFNYYYALGADLGTASGVPEPLTISLFGVGVAGLAAMRRRSAKKKA